MTDVDIQLDPVQALQEVLTKMPEGEVAGSLLITVEELQAILGGDREITDEELESIDTLELLAAQRPVQPQPAPPAPTAAEEAPEPEPAGVFEKQGIGADLDGDGIADVEFHGLGVVSRSGAWVETMDRQRVALRSAHAVAVMTQFRLGMDYQENVAALGLVTQIELALISFFGESFPDPGMPWDAERRAREVDKRLARLRWVERE